MRKMETKALPYSCISLTASLPSLLELATVHHYLLFPGVAVIILSVNDKIHNKSAMITVCQPLPHGSNPNHILFILIRNIMKTAVVLF
jgi:hypothetical protein